MGLASSQARLLLLTARKSDLEYRAQTISQRKIVLSMQAEQLATDYTQKISNKQMMYVFDVNGNENETLTEVLSYNGLTAIGKSGLGASYIVTDNQGRMVVPDANSLPAGFSSVSVAQADGSTKSYAYPTKTVKNSDGTESTVADTSRAEDRYEINVCSDISNPYVFQNALRGGGLYLNQYNNKTDSYDSFSWQGSDVIQDNLYTADDNLAETQYEAATLKLQTQDKMLDLELKQVETQHKAIETEVDSVKKVIDKNIETTYKIFANG
ncbi:MAG: hypothetical protein PHV37_02530 [Candidatus Gastranaerophilales bacterium]|nr:hypothetical protein [Candidatus Gastranaerophilales bacterium]